MEVDEREWAWYDRGMEKVKHSFEDDGAIDALERADLRAVWGKIAPTLEKAQEGMVAKRYELAREIRPENVRDYGKDRVEENLEMLEQVGNPQMVELYKKVIEENPQLCVVKLVDEDIDGNAFFERTMRDTTTGQVMPMVRFNFSHPETYRLKATETWDLGRKDDDKKMGIRYAMKSLALKVGASWRRCAQNKKLTTGMVFLHEMGHAQDFIDNYLVPEYMSREGMPVGQKMAESVLAANEKAVAASEQDARSHPAQDDSLMAGVVAYREMPVERYADDFAMDFFRRHREEYFVEEEFSEKPAKEKAKESLRNLAFGEERVRVEWGRELPLDADFVHLLGLTKGSSVKIEPVVAPAPEPTKYDLHEGDYGIYGYEESKRFDAEGNYVRPKHARSELGKHGKLGGEGELMTTLAEGGAIYLSSQERAVRVCENASGLRYVSRRDEEGRLLVEVYFDDEDGRKYRVERVR